MNDVADQLAFANDCINKLDGQVKRTEDERDKWRRLLVRVVGEEVAERMYHEALPAGECEHNTDGSGLWCDGCLEAHKTRQLG